MYAGLVFWEQHVGRIRLLKLFSWINQSFSFFNMTPLHLKYRKKHTHTQAISAFTTSAPNTTASYTGHPSRDTGTRKRNEYKQASRSVPWGLAQDSHDLRIDTHTPRQATIVRKATDFPSLISYRRLFRTPTNRISISKVRLKSLSVGLSNTKSRARWAPRSGGWGPNRYWFPCINRSDLGRG